MSGKPRCLKPGFCHEQNKSGKCDRKQARKLWNLKRKITCIYQDFGTLVGSARARCNRSYSQGQISKRSRLKLALKANEKFLEATM